VLDSLGEFDHRLDGFANLGVRLARSGILDEAIESPQSIIFDQAENRLHAQRALLAMLLAQPDL